MADEGAPEGARQSTKLKFFRGDSFVDDDGDLFSFLLDVSSCPNLVVLTGSGSSWDLDGNVTMGDLLTEAEGLPGFAEVAEAIGYGEGKARGTKPTDIEVFLTECQMLEDLQHSEPAKNFRTEAEKMIGKKCRFVTANTDVAYHEALLRAVVKRSPSLPRTQVFTTNYDRAFEVAATNLLYYVLDGFDYSSRPRFSTANFEVDLVRRDVRKGEFEPLANVFKLVKVHGSVDWTRESEWVTKSQEPERPVIVYPAHGKYEDSYNEPFLDGLTRYQEILREDKVAVVVVGYGFRDRHLNNPLRQAMKSNTGMTLVVVDPVWRFTPEDPDNPTDCEDNHAFYRRFVEQEDRRVMLVQADFKTFATEFPLYRITSERERLERRGHGN